MPLLRSKNWVTKQGKILDLVTKVAGFRAKASKNENKRGKGKGKGEKGKGKREKGKGKREKGKRGKGKREKRKKRKWERNARGGFGLGPPKAVLGRRKAEVHRTSCALNPAPQCRAESTIEIRQKKRELKVLSSLS